MSQYINRVLINNRHKNQLLELIFFISRVQSDPETDAIAECFESIAEAFYS